MCPVGAASAGRRAVGELLISRSFGIGGGRASAPAAGSQCARSCPYSTDPGRLGLGCPLLSTTPIRLTSMRLQDWQDLSVNRHHNRQLTGSPSRLESDTVASRVRCCFRLQFWCGPGCSYSWRLAKNATPRHALNSTNMTPKYACAFVSTLTQATDPNGSLFTQKSRTLLQSIALKVRSLVNA